MIRLFITLAFMSTSMPVWAGPKLWQNIEAGMSSEQIRTLYPASKAQPKVKWSPYYITLVDVPVGECIAEARIVTDKKLTDPASIVERVVLEGYGCAGKTFTALLGKYDEPLDKNRTVEVGGSWVNNDDTREATWVKDGVTIRFKSASGGIISRWTIVYEPTKDAGL